MQTPDEVDLIDFDSPPRPSTKNTPMPKQKQDITAWETCLAESKDKTRYPRVLVIDGPFQGFDDMLYAKENGSHNVANAFLRPTGPTHEHITLLQNLHSQGKSIDEIAAFLVVTYPDLMKGWRDGTEYDRRVQIHGLVNLWVSCWAPRFGEDGRVVAGGEDGRVGAEGDGRGGMGRGRARMGEVAVGGQREGERYEGVKEKEKEGREAVQRWLRG